MDQQFFQKLSSKPKLTKSGKVEPTPDSVFYSELNLRQNCTVDKPPTTPTQDREELDAQIDIIGKELEDYVKIRIEALEEKMFEKFYLMRIEQSKKFIDLTKKINKSRDDFVECLKAIGAQGASGDGDCSVYSTINASSLTGLSEGTNDSN